MPYKALRLLFTGFEQVFCQLLGNGTTAAPITLRR